MKSTGRDLLKQFLIREAGSQRPPTQHGRWLNDWTNRGTSYGVKIGMGEEEARDSAQALLLWIVRTWEDQYALPFHRTPEKQRENGIASGEARRKRTASRDALMAYLARTGRSRAWIARRQRLAPSTVTRAIRRIDPAFRFAHGGRRGPQITGRAAWRAMLLEVRSSSLDLQGARTNRIRIHRDTLATLAPPGEAVSDDAICEEPPDGGGTPSQAADERPPNADRRSRCTNQKDFPDRQLRRKTTPIHDVLNPPDGNSCREGVRGYRIVESGIRRVATGVGPATPGCISSKRIRQRDG